MPIVLQNRLRPGEVPLALASLIDAQITALRVAVAYTTRRGCNQLISFIESKLNEEKWRSIPKEIVTSLDYGITDPEALDLLSTVPNCSVFLAGTEVMNKANLRPGVSFHPKLYLIHKGDRRAVLAGSANLTETAFTINTEVIYTSEEEDPRTVDDIWQAIIEQAVPINDDLLNQYRERRQTLRRQQRAFIIDPDERPPVIEVPTVGELPVFVDAITSGDLDPRVFDRFWVEAGTMSSGGAHNQLELPRGANRFFNNNFDDYDRPHEVIDYLTLTIAGKAWNNRKLTWHGNNMMERINLPTKRQGGVEYRGSAILFARRDEVFELLIVAWDDPVTVSWREASTQIGRIYKLGQNSNRICGLF